MSIKYSAFFKRYTLLYAPNTIFRTLILIEMKFNMGYPLRETKILLSTNNYFISHIKAFDECEIISYVDEDADICIQAFIGIHIMEVEKYLDEECWYIY